MGRKQVATRLTDERHDRLVEYADRYDLTKSEAMRRLIQAGLDAEEGRATLPADEIREDLDEIRDAVADVESLDKTDADPDDTEMREVNQQITVSMVAATVVFAVILSVTSTPATVAAGATGGAGVIALLFILTGLSTLFDVMIAG